MKQTANARLFIMIGALYFSQGVPLGVAMEALPTLLRRDGAPLHALAWLPLVGLPWVLKFLWAPVVDNRYRPALGRRRSWILPMQGIVLACLAVVAVTGVSAASAPWVVALMALASLASATQDIATDGLTAERFEGQALARANAVQVGGTMIGFFAGGPGCLVLAGWLGQGGALALLAAVVAFSLLMASGWRETALPAAVRRATLAGFARRPGAWALALAAFLSAMTAVAGYGLSKLFLVDAGWAVEAVGRLGMAGGAVTVLLGCGGGAWLVGRIGARGAGAWPGGLGRGGAGVAGPGPGLGAAADGRSLRGAGVGRLWRRRGLGGDDDAGDALCRARRAGRHRHDGGAERARPGRDPDLVAHHRRGRPDGVRHRFSGGLLAAAVTLVFVAMALRRPG
ncbi:MFS transporter [Achromobacter insuavis]